MAPFAGRSPFKFSKLIEQCSKEDKKVRKAALVCSWMKVMSNFQCGKATQERMILERCLVNALEATTEDIHCVITEIDYQPQGRQGKLATVRDSQTVA